MKILFNWKNQTLSIESEEVGIPSKRSYTKQTVLEEETKPTKLKDTIPVGALKRPSVKELNLRNRTKEEKDGEEAVKESLDKIPELQEHKKKVEEERKQLEKLQMSAEPVQGIYD